jgi:cytochrome bd ubiquinol oxidase subunit II
MQTTFWLALLGCFLAGFLVLEGADFGMAMLLPVFGRHDQQARDGVIRAVAPFFLGNEVWLVAAVGTMNGAFPRLDQALESRLYPLFVLILIAWLTRDAGLWFRRHGGVRWQFRWDLTTAGASALLTFSWGLVLGNLAQAVPTPGSAQVFGLVPILSGLLLTGICLLHGAATLGLRLPPPEAATAAQVAKRVAPAVAALTVTCGAALTLTNAAPATTWPLWLLAAILLTATLIVRLTNGRSIALPATAAALAALFPLLALTDFPDLPTGLPLSTAAAAPATLTALTPAVLAVLPLLAAAQAALWWLCRGRVATRSWSYF